MAETLTGWPQAEALGRPLPDVFRIVNEQTRRPVENPALRALREGTVVGLANHTVLIARDGTERPIDDSAAPMRDEAGDAVGAVLVFRDVTERKRAEEARARLAAIVESSEDAIVSKTLDGVIRSWNAGAERLFGYTPEEAVGRPITLIIPPERLDEEAAILARLRRGERVEHFETVRVAKDGRRIRHLPHGLPLRDEAGVIVGASKIARDVTARNRAELALRESEALHRVLVDLASATQPLTDPAEVMAASARVLAEYLGVDRCAYAEVEGESVYVITGDHAAGVPSIVGRWAVGAFGAEHLRMMRAGEPYVVEDADADPRVAPADLPAYRATRYAPSSACRCTRAAGSRPRWPSTRRGPGAGRPRRCRLVAAVVGRCWEALERARVARRAGGHPLADGGGAGGRGDRHLGLGRAGRPVLRRRQPGPDLLVHPRECRGRPPGRPHGRRSTPTTATGSAALVERAVESGGRYEADYRVTDGPGGWRWVTARGQVERDAAGRAVRFPGVVIDVTDRKRAEEELARVTAESERRRRLYETILSATPDFVYVFSLDHRFLYANDALIADVGARPEEAIGKTFLEIGYEPWHAEMH